MSNVCGEVEDEGLHAGLVRDAAGLSKIHPAKGDKGDGHDDRSADHEDNQYEDEKGKGTPRLSWPPPPIRRGGGEARGCPTGRTKGSLLSDFGATRRAIGHALTLHTSSVPLEYKGTVQAEAGWKAGSWRREEVR